MDFSNAKEIDSSDRCCFHLLEEEFQRFNDMLNNPPRFNPKLAKLLAKKPSWERG